MPKSESRTRKRKYQGNQHSKSARKSPKRNDSDAGNISAGDGSVRLSASARKLHSPKSGKDDKKITRLPTGKLSGYRFMNMEILASVFEQMPCKDCGEFALVLAEDSLLRKGCSSFLSLQCRKCGWKNCFYTSRKVNHYFEVNRRLVYGMRTIGQGASSAKRFCGIMNMPPPPKPNAYDKHNKALLRAAKSVADETMIRAGEEIHLIKGPNNDNISQCGVSCDGTWQRRGYSSMNGCVTALSMDTGKCLDAEVLSKICRECQRHASHEETEEERVWQADHAGKCKANYSGSSPAMETVGVKSIFQRSVDKHKLQYTEYYGDGDSKGFNEAEDTYVEEGVKVVKKECVGHVQKRLGTALRKLKKEKKGMGGKGKLTDAMIDRLQNYYGIAIRSNVGDLDGMKKAIYASLMHCASSKKRNLHTYCPDGPESWCRYKKDIANKTKLYKPGSGLPDAIIAELKPIYARLSRDDLLKRCLDGKTQNQNESINGMIWDRVPKGVFVGSDTLRLGVYDAVAHFNIGSEAALKVLTNLGMQPGKFCTEEMSGADKLRIKKANYKADDSNKKRRKVLRARKKHKGDKVQEKEGVTYAAGGF